MTLEVLTARNGKTPGIRFGPEINLGEWAIASHGKGTRPFRKIVNVDINHHITY